MPTLNWIGKEAVINHHDEVPIHTLTHNPDRSHTEERHQRAFLGSADGVYLLLSDDILTEELIDRLPRHDGSKIIHCGGTQLTEATLKQLGITFRQMPYNLV